MIEKFLDSSLLVVDDDVSNNRVFQTLLEEEGYQVKTAFRGREALEIIAKTPPDVILLDLIMPEMSGLEVLDALMKNKETADIPVIVVSVKSEIDDVKIALDKGAIDYIKKPVFRNDLLARVRSALRIKSREDALKRFITLKDQFISIVSHDLRSPFTSIIGCAEYILSDQELQRTLDLDARQCLEYIFTESSSLLDYIEKLLNMAYLESGKLKLNIKKIPLAGLVENSIKIYSSKIYQKKINVELDVDHSIYIDVDKTLFIHVINNLLGNAVKFTPNRGIIKVFASEEDGKTTLVISDSGVGIEPENADKIFNEFEKFYTAGTEGETGSGLGLSICKKIVLYHGFDLKFRSTPGKGTDFFITMPKQGSEYNKGPS